MTGDAADGGAGADANADAGTGTGTTASGGDASADADAGSGSGSGSGPRTNAEGPDGLDGTRETTWLDVFDDVLDEVVDDGSTVEASFDDLRVEIPLRYGADATRAEWGFDGSVTVHVEGLRGPLAEWMRWWGRGGDAD
jgi:hypothetical protein